MAYVFGGRDLHRLTREANSHVKEFRRVAKGIGLVGKMTATRAKGLNLSSRRPCKPILAVVSCFVAQVAGRAPEFVL
jgi:hypothetical protein